MQLCRNIGMTDQSVNRRYGKPAFISGKSQSGTQLLSDSTLSFAFLKGIYFIISKTNINYFIDDRENFYCL